MFETQAKPQGAPLSKARRAGPLLFVSGQLPRDASGKIVAGDIAVQARQALDNLQAVLADHGATPAQVVKVNVWLTDAADFAAFNQAYRERFDEPFPARSLVISGLVAKGAKVEVEAIAFLG